MGVGPFVLEGVTTAGEPWPAAFELSLRYPTGAGLKGSVGTVAPEAQRIEQAQLTRSLQQLLKKEGFRSRGHSGFLTKAEVTSRSGVRELGFTNAVEWPLAIYL